MSLDGGPRKITEAVLASLRFVGERLDPGLVTEKLGISPTKAIRPGQEIIRGSQHQYRNGAWVLRSDLPESSSVAQHIEHLLNKVAKRGDALHWLSLHGFTGEFFCSYCLMTGPEPETSENLREAARVGIQLPAETLSRIGASGLGLIVDVRSLDADDSPGDTVSTNARRGQGADESISKRDRPSNSGPE